MSGELSFFFGLRSPYAWLAQRLLHKHLGTEARARIEWVPYWEPTPATLAALERQGGRILYRPMSRERHLYILGDVKALTARLGLQLRWPVDGAAPQWEFAHRACLMAPPEHAASVRNTLFSARWEHGLDIADPAVVAGLCRGLGLPQLPASLDSAAADERAVAALLRAHRLGVFGLPTFAWGRQRWWGVDRLPFALRAAGLPWQALAAEWVGLGDAGLAAANNAPPVLRPASPAPAPRALEPVEAGDEVSA